MKKGLKVSELLSENDRLVRRVLSLSEDNLGLTQENDALIDDIDVLTSEIEEIKRETTSSCWPCIGARWPTSTCT